ncbi:MAG: hypothetical protein IJ676_04565, partial [Clostridia bacterium]|nr:hypothetical protein [Clostridia bacterium]
GLPSGVGSGSSVGEEVVLIGDGRIDDRVQPRIIFFAVKKNIIIMLKKVFCNRFVMVHLL